MRFLISNHQQADLGILKVPTSDGRLSLTLFCYALNEEELIEAFLRKAVRKLGEFTKDFEIIFHDDGSTDGTLKLAQKMAQNHPQIRVFSNERNRGVGYCCQQSFRLATKEWLFVNTVDEFWNMSRLEDFIPYFKDFDLVTGVRLERKSCYTLWRQIISWTNYFLVRFLFGLKMRDVQNVHFYKRDFVQNLPLESTSSFISPEILIKARAAGLRVKEVPMVYQPRRGGKAKGARLKSLFHSFWELLRFWTKWYILGYERKFIRERIIR